MNRKLFSEVAIREGNKKWEQSISRIDDIYKRDYEIRSEFSRDYNRILHSTAYRRLKHKTQVFFATENDHICTRIEHVNHVSSVSYTIADYLGLNTELTRAIAIGHDLGHAPFGHEGEKILKDFVENNLGNKFWHEKNSLRFIDRIETLPNLEGKENNLNLTYAVRDGIICQCGEVKSTAIFPREEAVDLYSIEKAGEVSSYTWEGCVVKIADKIAYLGRDIEDALKLEILDRRQLETLTNILNETVGTKNIREINNTVLMYNIIIDLCKNSSPDDGIVLSDGYLEFIERVKDFNYRNIYLHKRLDNFKKYAHLVLNTIIGVLSEYYDEENTLIKIKSFEKKYPSLYETFSEWLIKYSNRSNVQHTNGVYSNYKIYNLKSKEDYFQSIIDYISGMTDSFAIKVFNEIIRF